MKPALRRHFSRFIDTHRYPDFHPDDAAWTAFSCVQSHGHKAINEGQRATIAPLLDAQENKEITIKTLVAEMAEWWALNAGWAHPLAATIQAELERDPVDEVYLRALLNIDVSCGGGAAPIVDGTLLHAQAPDAERMWRDLVDRQTPKRTFLDFLLSYTGFSDEERRRYLDWKFGKP